MSRFHDCLDIVLGHEGGYADVPGDKGGKTNYGITQLTYDAWQLRRGLPSRPVAGIHQTEVEAIYAEYWKDARCGVMPEPLDLVVFDCAINSGAKRAIKLLQYALGIPADGVYGRVTADAIHEEVVADGVDHLALLYLFERDGFYRRLVDADPSQEKFLQGWLNRTEHLREMIK